jgi:hypothetical protein
MGTAAARLIAIKATQIRAFMFVKRCIVIMAIKGEG